MTENEALKKFKIFLKVFFRVRQCLPWCFACALLSLCYCDFNHLKIPAPWGLSTGMYFKNCQRIQKITVSCPASSQRLQRTKLNNLRGRKKVPKGQTCLQHHLSRWDMSDPDGVNCTDRTESIQENREEVVCVCLVVDSSWYDSRTATPPPTPHLSTPNLELLPPGLSPLWIHLCHLQCCFKRARTQIPPNYMRGWLEIEPLL